MSKRLFIIVLIIAGVSCLAAAIAMSVNDDETSYEEQNEYDTYYNDDSYESESSYMAKEEIENNEASENNIEDTNIKRETPSNDENSEWTDLQKFFFEIDDKYTIRELKEAAEQEGYYTKKIGGLPGYIVLIDISNEESPKLGDASEEWYMYEDDHIQVSFYSEETAKGTKMICSQKTYYIQNTHMIVECDADNKNIRTENHIPGYEYEDVKHEEKANYKTLEEAMKYALKYDAWHEE